MVPHGADQAGKAGAARSAPRGARAGRCATMVAVSETPPSPLAAAVDLARAAAEETAGDPGVIGEHLARHSRTQRGRPRPAARR